MQISERKTFNYPPFSKLLIVRFRHTDHYVLDKVTNIFSTFLRDSFNDKKNTYEKLIKEEKVLTAKLKDLDHKISLINKNDPDYLDMLYRQKFNYVTEDEIIIKLK